MGKNLGKMKTKNKKKITKLEISILNKAKMLNGKSMILKIGNCDFREGLKKGSLSPLV